MNSRKNHFISPSMNLLYEITHAKRLPIPKKIQQKIIFGFKKEIIELFFRFTIFSIAIKTYKNPVLWVKVPLALDRKRRENIGTHRLQKLAQIEKTYFWGLYTPGWSWKSQTFKNFIAGEMNRIVPFSKKSNRLTNAYVSITKKCALQCEHCYEWDNLNKKETLSQEELHQTIEKLQNLGVALIHFSGGEPLIKIDCIIELIAKSRKGTDFWVLTSGFKLTSENAKKLKHAGLKGVIVSLDHFIPEEHNRFRGFKDAYFWVETAVQNAIQNNLAVALSICLTKSFTTPENLMQYVLLAKKLGVTFVQFLEPRAVGHYANMDVDLKEEQIQLLEEFYLKLNYSSKYQDFPLITYHGYNQRKMGCSGAGNRSLYIDSEGEANACPFCQKKSGSFVYDDSSVVFTSLKSNGCQKFNHNTN
ncbi:radical SAM protein [Flavobacterium sp. GCM10027622]|uniref:radical SAM protein n=1 Tax=unclassified Flavobacterium TaxID=196869 RepID=UPI00361E4B06